MVFAGLRVRMVDRPPALRLVLMRHADAERAVARDLDRRLTRKGREDATAMGKRLAETGLRPDVCLTSPAPRAAETAQAAVAAWGDGGVAVRHVAAIYDASLESLTAMLGKESGPASCVLVVGHNPGLSELAVWLAGLPLEWSLDKAAVAVLRIRSDWAGLSRGCGRLVDLLEPPALGRRLA
jgi:phosphohistidine phosphatase